MKYEDVEKWHDDFFSASVTVESRESSHVLVCLLRCMSWIELAALSTKE